MGSIRKKTGSRKNGRNNPSPVFVPFPYFSVNTKTVGSNVENGTGRVEIFSVRFQPYCEPWPVWNKIKEFKKQSRAPLI
jgi:hypothetical protein